jgi:hypothetical protein
MMRMIWLFSLLSIFTCVASKNLLTEILSSYRTILQAINPALNETSLISPHDIMHLMGVLDGNPKYNTLALSQITELIIGDRIDQKFSWDFFETAVTKIYGDQISEDPYTPQEIHLALTDTTEKMKVMWVTMENLEKPFVQYAKCAGGEQPDWDGSAMTENADNYTYTVPQNWWPIFTGVIYEVDMTGLEADTAYTYRVGGYDPANATTRYSTSFTFRSKPVSNDPNRKTVIATLADHGTFMLLGFATINKMVAMRESLGFEMIFVAGDLSYAGLSSAIPQLNITKEDEFEHVWDLLGIQNQPIAAVMPWMVGNGNHERFYNWTAYTNRFKMPASAGNLPSTGNFWYSFDYGNVHWVSLSSEHDLAEGSPQQAFLLAALQAATANRGVVPWIVVSIHKPLYCSAHGTPGGYAALLEPLLLQYDVDLTIVGHMHAYERVHPVKDGEVTAYPTSLREGGLRHTVDVYNSLGKGPVHVVQGHAGGMQAERWYQPQPAWSAVRFANGFYGLNTTNTDSLCDKDTVTNVGSQCSLYHHGFRVDLSDESTQTDELLHDLPLFPPTTEGDGDRKKPVRTHVNYEDTYGFGVITAMNATHLHYQSTPDTDSTGVGTDEFWVVKDRHSK